MKVRRLGSCENFVRKREELVFDASKNSVLEELRVRRLAVIQEEGKGRDKSAVRGSVHDEE